MAGAPQKPPETQAEPPPAAIEDRERFLHPGNAAEAAKFVQGTVWQDFKRVLIYRCPPPADVTDDIHVAAAKGFKATSWMELIRLIERLPFEAAPLPPEPLIPDAITDPRD